MSSSFGGVLPAVIPFSGTCDAKGNLTLTIRPRAAFWWSGKMVATVSAGSPAWLASEGGIPAGTTRGQRAELGGLIVAPGDVVTIQVIGALPNATVQGSLRGSQAPTMELAAQDFSAAPNTVSVDVAAPTILLGSVVAALGAGGATGTFTIPPNAYALVLLPEVSGVGALINSLNVQGVTSLDFYLNDLSFNSGSIPAAPIYVPLGTQPKDAQVTVGFGITAGAGQPAIDVIALLAPIATASILTGVGNASIATGQQDTSNPASKSVPVVPAEFYTPAPWQAAAFNAGINAISVNSGATLVIVAASALKTVYLHDYSFSQDNANAAAHWTLQDTAGTVLADFFDAAVRHVFAQGGFAGAPVTSGRGVQIVNNGAAASFIGGYLSYSQI